MNQENSQMGERGGWQEIGEVSHIFDKIAVAAITLSGSLKVGDRIKFANCQLEQTVDSMQIDKQPVEQADAGDQVGIKYDQSNLNGKIRLKEKVLKSVTM